MILVVTHRSGTSIYIISCDSGGPLFYINSSCYTGVAHRSRPDRAWSPLALTPPPSPAPTHRGTSPAGRWPHPERPCGSLCPDTSSFGLVGKRPRRSSSESAKLRCTRLTASETCGRTGREHSFRMGRSAGIGQQCSTSCQQCSPHMRLVSMHRMGPAPGQPGGLAREVSGREKQGGASGRPRAGARKQRGTRGRAVAARACAKSGLKQLFLNRI